MTTIGVCVFSALTSVGALFYFCGELWKEIRTKKSQEFVEKVVKQVQTEMEENFNIALNNMNIVEKELADSLIKEQKGLYDKFCKARDNFYKKAKTIYKKRF